MIENIPIQDVFYILAGSSTSTETIRNLKSGDTFLIADRYGNIKPIGFENHGLFHEDTRVLSKLALKFASTNPLLLSSKIAEKNNLLVIDLTNADCIDKNGNHLAKNIVHINRSILLWKGCYYERIKFINFSLSPIEAVVSLEFEADYRDIFEIRGVHRPKRGKLLDPKVESKSLVLAYQGLDETVRKTRIDFISMPASLNSNGAIFNLDLKANEEKEISFIISCTTDDIAVETKTYDFALEEIKKFLIKDQNNLYTIETSNEQFNEWLNISQTDLFMMLTHTSYGVYPYAGIPWYSTVFGRDGLITAIETLWLFPDIARGVLTYLANKQATESNDETDADPGKILHEERKGEMAKLKEIPFVPYYGTADATPLFILLAGLYYERTGDKEFIEHLWPNIERALSWIDNYGDIDHDGFVEYATRSSKGLINQGWKDSADAIFHADSSLAAAPIALCEVQGYVYSAKIKAANMAFVLEKPAEGNRLLQEAKTLRENFIKAFWCEELKTYALALDKDKKPCQVQSSNAGHCLFSGIADEEHAKLIMKNLTDETFLTAWGIRTISSSQSRYNPMSYHNGSIWPHDNAIIAEGMKRYGFNHGVIKIMTSIFESSIFMHLHRLPELFCGFSKYSDGSSPTLYPVACNPQSWASGAVFLLLQSCLGLSINAAEKRIYFDNPILPAFLERIKITNLKVGQSSVDLAFRRYGQTVAINILDKKGDIDVIIKQ